MSELSIFGGSRTSGTTPNPFFDVLTSFVPRKLKDLFRWAEYLYAHSPAIYTARHKLATYAVTRVVVDEPDEALRSMWDTCLTKHVKVRSSAIETGIDEGVYGNSFLTVYQPFDRFLVCGHAECGELTGITHVKYEFQLRTLKFRYTCAACRKPTVGTIKDRRVANMKRIALIRWDPKLIDIDHNPLTGASRYYYSIPAELTRKVEKGNSHIINTTPLGFLQAIQQKKIFLFAENQVFHVKQPSPAGLDAQWGMPPLLCTIKMFYYAAVLRKANEAIALDHLVPLRVLHPVTGAGTEPAGAQINMGQWQSIMRENIRMWRRDPLHIMMSPVALGVTTMGGQGRALMTLGEVKEADDNVIMGMGVPIEFLRGGLTLAGSGVSLRMLENQLETSTELKNEQLEWVIARIADIMGWRPVAAHYVPFKFIDDTDQKTALMHLQQLLGNPMSTEKMLESYDVDLRKEREKRKNEQLEELRLQMAVQNAQQKLVNSASVQADQQAAQGAGLGYNIQAVVAKGDEIAQQLAGLMPGERRSQMDHMSQTDPVMYAVVKDRLEAQAQMARHTAVAEAQQQQAPGTMV